jgi:hypothetical protein
MQTTVYDKNCAALVAKYGDKLPMQPPKVEDIQSRVKVVNGELGFPNVAFVSDNELHRLYEEPNPYKEIQALVEKELNDPDVTHIVTLGLGLGYLLAELIRCKENKAKVFVLEPDMAILYECLRFLDLSQMIEDEKVVFVLQSDGTLAGEKLASLIQLTDSAFKGWRFVSVFNSFRLYPEYSKQVIHIFGSKMISQKLNLNTVHIHGEIFLKHSLINLTQLNNESYLSSYENLFTGLPCIIISAGPSLTKQLPQLKVLQHHVVLFAVGQTIKTLHAEGINPHFVLGVDPWMLPWFESDGYTREVLVCNTVFDPAAIPKVPGHKIFASYTNEIDERMAPVIGKIGHVNNGGSVANFSYSVAKFMGFQTIGFVGQDLAYTGGVSHASGYIAREEKSDEELASNTSFRKVPGYYGDMVYTNTQMDTYRDWFETEIKNDHEYTVYNCTEGGACIRGTTQIPLSEFINTHDLFTLSSPEIPAFPQKINSAKLIVYLQNDLQSIYSAKELAKTGLSACVKAAHKPNDLNSLQKAKSAIIRTQKFLAGLNSKKFNPYLTVLWNFSLHQIAKVETSENASPDEVVKPFIPFFYDLNQACLTTENMLTETIHRIKKGDPKVASAKHLQAVI